MSDLTSHVPPPLPQPETGIYPASAVAPPAPPTRAEPRLRLWPGVVIVALMWLVITLRHWVELPGGLMFATVFFGPIAAASLLALWWLLGSRLPWADRLLVLGAAAVLCVGTMFLLLAPELGSFGLVMYVLSKVATAWVLWLVATPFLRWPVRRAGLLVALFLACGYFGLVRFDGIDGNFNAEFNWRWAPVPENDFLAQRAAGANAPKPETPAVPKVSIAEGDWPEFRGPRRDGRVTGLSIAADWKQHPPRELWRHRVGPGWSSFAVVGKRLYTQEQVGKDEAVVCYHTDTGAELWSHTDAARFSEIVAGPGPRATPTVHGDKVYALGASGLLNCLDATTGKVHWSRDVAKDSGAAVPQWGFSSSPLVAQGVVTVFVGGPDGKSVIGYKADTGDPAWLAGEGLKSYCSPQLARLHGTEQVLVATDAGLFAFEPKGGAVLWKHDWPTEQGRIVQPAVLGDDVLVGTGMGVGTRRLHVTHAGESWGAQEAWTTLAIKPYFNDLVIHKGHLYGFDGAFLTCVSLEDGAGRWRARGYDNGQLLLLPDQDLLLVLSEKGEVALVEANPEAHKQRGKFKALDGKTWNHPVLAHGLLFVRNGKEAACYQLADGGK